MPNISTVILGAGAVSLLAGCCPKFICPEVETQKITAIKKCAESEIVKSSVIIYTGPVGAKEGSRWVKLSDELMVVAAEVDDIFPPKAPDNIFATTPDASNCSFNQTTKVDLGGELGVSVKTLPVSATLKGKIGDSSKITATVDGFQWRWVKFDTYNEKIKALKADSTYRNPGMGRYTSLGMLKVNGYTALVEFTNNTDLGVGVGYTGPLPASLAGEVNAGVTASITKEGKLELKIPGESYVAGVFRPVKADGTTESSTINEATEKIDWNVRIVDVKNRKL